MIQTSPIIWLDILLQQQSSCALSMTGRNLPYIIYLIFARYCSAVQQLLQRKIKGLCQQTYTLWSAPKVDFKQYSQGYAASGAKWSVPRRGAGAY
jgi:hypothetical protein